ncbi:MAG: TIGR02444 family protein [Rhodospirillaceae bacterium]|nr:TIGR02444 family protein [Rhodospirillaceae bacterium]
MTEETGREIAKGNPFWEFATSAYSQPGVEKAMLSLQDRMGVDINMVLFCVWLAAYKGPNGNGLAEHLAGALQISGEWQRGLVGPLRTCRENLKIVVEGPDLSGRNREVANALRGRLKANELDLEALQILVLYGLVATGGLDEGEPIDVVTQKEDAQNNLNVYFEATSVTLDHLAQGHVLRLLNNVFQ